MESKGRKNSELRILEEARQILLHSKVGNKTSGRETGEDLSGQGMEAPFDEDRMIGQTERTETTGKKVNRIRTRNGGKQPAAAQEKGKDGE